VDQHHHVISQRTVAEKEYEQMSQDFPLTPDAGRPSGGAQSQSVWHGTCSDANASGTDPPLAAAAEDESFIFSDLLFVLSVELARLSGL